MAVEKILSFIKQKPDLMFAIILAFFVYCVFAFTNDYFMTHRTTFAIMERFAVLGLVGLASVSYTHLTLPTTPYV